MLPSASGGLTAYKGGYDIVSLQMLKAVAILLVVQLHSSSPLHDYLVPLCRIAVPIFYMITGYFLLNKEGILQSSRLKRSFVKILKITAVAQVVYFFLQVWQHPVVITSFGHSLKPWWQFFLFGNNFCAAFWYLQTLLEALLVLMLCVKYNLYRWLPIVTVLGVVTNLLIGRYSFVDFEGAYMVHRNFFTITLPCLYLGMIIRLNEHRISISKKKLLLILAVTIALLYVEYSLDRRFKFDGGDIVVMTLPVAVITFILALKVKVRNNWVATVGREHSSNIYIYHILVKIVLEVSHLSFYKYATLEIFCGTLLLSYCLTLVKRFLGRAKHIFRDNRSESG